jgi:hypothetical protein
MPWYVLGDALTMTWMRGVESLIEGVKEEDVAWWMVRNVTIEFPTSSTEVRSQRPTQGAFTWYVPTPEWTWVARCATMTFDPLVINAAVKEDPLTLPAVSVMEWNHPRLEDTLWAAAQRSSSNRLFVSHHTSALPIPQSTGGATHTTPTRGGILMLRSSQDPRPTFLDEYDDAVRERCVLTKDTFGASIMEESGVMAWPRGLRDDQLPWNKLLIQHVVSVPADGTVIPPAWFALDERARMVTGWSSFLLEWSSGFQSFWFPHVRADDAWWSYTTASPDTLNRIAGHATPPTRAESSSLRRKRVEDSSPRSSSPITRIVPNIYPQETLADEIDAARNAELTDSINASLPMFVQPLQGRDATSEAYFGVWAQGAYTRWCAWRHVSQSMYDSWDTVERAWCVWLPLTRPEDHLFSTLMNKAANAWTPLLRCMQAACHTENLWTPVDASFRLQTDTASGDGAPHTSWCRPIVVQFNQPGHYTSGYMWRSTDRDAWNTALDKTYGFNLDSLEMRGGGTDVGHGRKWVAYGDGTHPYLIGAAAYVSALAWMQGWLLQHPACRAAIDMPDMTAEDRTRRIFVLDYRLQATWQAVQLQLLSESDAWAATIPLAAELFGHRTCVWSLEREWWVRHPWLQTKGASSWRAHDPAAQSTFRPEDQEHLQLGPEYDAGDARRYRMWTFRRTPGAQQLSNTCMWWSLRLIRAAVMQVWDFRHRIDDANTNLHVLVPTEPLIWTLHESKEHMNTCAFSSRVQWMSWILLMDPAVMWRWTRDEEGRLKERVHGEELNESGQRERIRHTFESQVAFQWASEAGIAYNPVFGAT